MIGLLAVVCSTLAVPAIEAVPGQAPLGYVEVHGVQAGAFNPQLWQNGTLHILPDFRSPLIEPRMDGGFRNIYAPSAVEMPEGWRIFYGAWDGVESGNDRIYSVDTGDFFNFANRTIVIEHGSFIHVCNVNASRRPDGSFEMVCTAYPDADGLNKPAYFSSPDGLVWNGTPAPHPATPEDIVSIEGYEAYKAADINGMNVHFRDGETLYLYFNNFKDFGRVYRAKGTDGKHFTFEGPVLETGHAVNDVKKFAAPDGSSWYLMGLHMNTDGLWYSLSQDPASFSSEQPLLKSQGDRDKYIVAIGWVTRGNQVLGALYGAGAVPGLNRNRIFASWLQRKVIFVADDGTRYEPSAALGPDRQLIALPEGEKVKGHFEVYGEDGSTVVANAIPGELVSGSILALHQPEAIEKSAENADKGASKPTSLTLTPLSGRFGYHVKGDFFEGTITKERPGATPWHFEGKFTFPTAGWSVAKPRARMTKSIPEQVVIVMGITPPAPDAMVAQVIVEEPIDETLIASDEAKFVVAIDRSTRSSRR